MRLGRKAVVAFLLIALTALSLGAALGLIVRAQTSTTTFISLPPSQTVFIGGATWGPVTTLNPYSPSFGSWAGADFYYGMVYLPLFLWSPYTGQLYPALGKNWTVTSVDVPAYMVYNVSTSNTTPIPRAALIVWLWPNATWQDGYPVTADDVVFSYYLNKFYPSLPDAWMFERGPGSIINITPVNEHEVMFIFNSSPSSPPWWNIIDEILIGVSIPIIPLHEFYPNLSAFFQNYSKWDPLTWNPTPTDIIGDGPYRVYTYTSAEFVLVKWDGWWGWNIWGVPDNGAYAPEYVADLMVTSNAQAIPMFESGELTWGGYFVTDVWTLTKYHIHTFYDHPPWNLQMPPSATTWTVNFAMPPFNSTLVRRAIAEAINTQAITSIGENGQELPVNKSNAFGLAGPYNAFNETYGKYVNWTVVDEYGWTFNLTQAKLLMEEAAKEYGWHLNSQGYWVTPQGWVVNVTIMVPYGWTDFMTDANMIAQNLSKIGIEATTQFLSYSEYYNDFFEGNYYIANAPYSWGGTQPAGWFEFWLDLDGYAPVGSWAWADMERFYGQNATQAWNDLQNIFYTNPNNYTGLMYYYSDLEKIFFSNVVMIPIATSAYWYEYSTQYWEGWPNASNPGLFPPSPWYEPGNAYVLVHLYPRGVVVTTTTPAPVTVTTTSTATVVSSTTTTVPVTSTVTPTAATTVVTSVTTVVSSLVTTVSKVVSSSVAYAALAVAVIAIIIAIIAVVLRK